MDIKEVIRIHPGHFIEEIPWRQWLKSRREILLVTSGILVLAAGPVRLFMSGGYTPASQPTKQMIFQMEADMLEGVISDYHKTYGALPPVENAKLINALLGNNPTRRKFLYLYSVTLNDKKEVVDPWGNPLRFKQVDNTIKVIEPTPPLPSFRF